ncbi:FecR family protein [Chitinophaga vietnamensis]|uniref:FecR family protein n=1 Tax=Chitinophaga vietnamensis TaxID=2593957 RepID=UPI001177BB3A|nr:FecR domain-containing protein [Chitinophaga vietnamensis]
MQDERIHRLIGRYLAGHATPAEQQELDIWFAQLHTPPTATDDTPRALLGEKIYGAIRERIHEKEGARVIPMRASRTLRWRLAASVISAAIVTAGGLLYRAKMPARKAPVKYLDLYTRAGQLSKVILTDSSIVWLNAGSHLRYPETFTGNRTVYLQGEACFDIHQDPQHPFIIESEGYHTQVLGTTFSIRSYPAPDVYKVTVASGKVAVYKPGDSARAVLLTAGQEVRMQHDGPQEVRNVHADALLSWRSGKLTFEKDPLQEVIVSLQNRYNVTFEITRTALRRMEVSGTFDHSQSLNDILKILSKVYGLHFSKNANGIIRIS